MADVVLRDGRIACVGTCAAPKDAEVVDVRGKFLIPGLIDMHVHVLAHPWNDQGELEPRFDHATVKHLLRQLLDNSVTTIRDAGSETEAAVTFRAQLERGAIAGPRLFTAGRILNASPFNPEPFAPRFTAEEFRDEIRWQKAVGVDVIKIYGSTPPELARVAIDEAHKQGLPIIGHLARTTWTEAARMGIDGLEHAAPWTPDLLPKPAFSLAIGPRVDKCLVDPFGVDVATQILELLEGDVGGRGQSLLEAHRRFF